MKKLLWILLAFALSFSACKNDDNLDVELPPIPLNPQQVQWGLVVNQTATWCGNCGSWGSPLLHTLSAMNSGKVVAITPHSSSDPMYNSSLYTSISADRKTGGGIPAFWVGDDKVSSSTGSSKMTTLISRTPAAGIDMQTTKNSDNFSVRAQAKFFTAGSGDYYLSFFILEDGINGNSSAGSYAQSGTSNAEYKHDYVLRKSFTSNFYGEKVATDPASGSKIEREFTFTYDNAAWTNTVYVGAALWHYNPNGDPTNFIPKYEFVNGFIKR